MGIIRACRGIINYLIEPYRHKSSYNKQNTNT
nr:MAG TPA: hypothetical protein [Caudoviricetes sp.]